LNWVFLPAAVFWIAVTPVHGKLVVSGPVDRGPKCAYLTVDTQSRHTVLRRGDCSQTGRLSPRILPLRAHTQWQDVRVAGALAFRFSNASDTKVTWAYGGGSLWVYDVWTQQGAQLARFSLKSGRLEQRVRFPKLFKPVLAANDAGAFLMANPSGGVSGERTAALYFVSPHATRPLALQRSSRAALWMTAHGRTLWLETITGTKTFKLWRYDGSRGRLLWTRNRSHLFGATYGGGALWGVAAPYCAKTVRVVRIDAVTGSLRIVAREPLLDCNQLGAGAYFRGAFWFVNGNELERVRG
jgi:hypothetical protein